MRGVMNAPSELTVLGFMSIQYYTAAAPPDSPRLTIQRPVWYVVSSWQCSAVGGGSQCSAVQFPKPSSFGESSEKLLKGDERDVTGDISLHTSFKSPQWAKLNQLSTSSLHWFSMQCSLNSQVVGAVQFPLGNPTDFHRWEV
ncbi:hypothetical protein BDD12DRAFT_806038 [Trichophaea hybrida]|nr:hypothetical protein BDD12DRAFT_806038 [Trichophaea hybrida]